MSAAQDSVPQLARVDERTGLTISTVVTRPHEVALTLRGEMDVSNAGLLGAVLTNQLTLDRHVIRLDLSRLGFCDCAGLRVIVYGHNQCLAAGGSLTLTRLSPSLTRMLTLTGLDDALTVADRTDRTDLNRARHLATTPDTMNAPDIPQSGARLATAPPAASGR
jgi:anti-anti-sigma factor